MRSRFATLGEPCWLAVVHQPCWARAVWVEERIAADRDLGICLGDIAEHANQSCMPMHSNANHLGTGRLQPLMQDGERAIGTPNAWATQAAVMSLWVATPARH
jgi:hypothetical protein